MTVRELMELLRYENGDTPVRILGEEGGEFVVDVERVELIETASVFPSLHAASFPYVLLAEKI